MSSATIAAASVADAVGAGRNSIGMEASKTLKPSAW